MAKMVIDPFIFSLCPVKNRGYYRFHNASAATILVEPSSIPNPLALVDEVDAEEVQDQAAYNEVGECPGYAVSLPFNSTITKGELRVCLPLGGYRRELGLVRLGGLHSERRCRLLVSLFPTAASVSVNIPVRTNWPTVAEKPERKALNGWAAAKSAYVCL